MSGVQGWVLDYLLNAAWQVPVLFATAWVAAKLLRGAGSAVEHRIWASALVLEAVLPACSLPVERVTAATALLRAWLFGAAQNDGARVTVAMGAGYVRGGVRVAPTVLTVIAVVYAASVLYFALRLLVAMVRTAALRRSAKPTMLLVESARRYERMFGVREPVIALSAKIAGPVTLGVWRHRVLLPAAIGNEVAGEDMEAALAHEFAHIARGDFAKNLLYELLSLPVAFHPLLWLTRRRVAASREMVCDALAAEVVEGRQRYARSLLRLASEFATRTPAVSTHAIGIFDANTFRNFERRIMSLTEKRVEMQGARRAAMVTLSVVLGVGVCTSAMALRMQVSGAQAAPVTVQTVPVTSVQTTTPSAPNQVLVAVPSNGGKPKTSFKIDLDPAQIAAAETDPASGLKVVRVGGDAENVPIPQGSALQVSPGVMAGQILTKTQPVYPQEAKDAKLSGAVVLKAVIGKDGAIRDLQLVSGPDVLAKSAWAAVKEWTYKPYLLNGNPVEVETTITVHFSMAN